uniref:adenine phosphoribosyltransferase n=1 Tax=Marseillevirus LCMAC201 TaxID=2506605 RepID=A0A481YYH4_9VIRU|nr:MAG: phosphoribosyl transferase domain protein [Marseillevirus LCMAC201]
MSDKKLIFVVSTCDRMADAVKCAYNKMWIRTHVRLIDTATTCNQEQLVGYVQARHCVRQRLTGLCLKIPCTIIAIENYIDHHGNQWWNAPMIIIANGTGKILAESPPWKKNDSVSVNITKYALKYASDLSKTIGQITTNDWRVHFSKYGYDHNDLTSALKKTLKFMDIRDILTETLGINFLDINPILTKPLLFDKLITLILSFLPTETTHIAIMGLQGSIIGAAVAARVGLPTVLICKSENLPGKVHNGTDTLEIHVPQGSKVVFIDYILKTGVIAKAISDLVNARGATVSWFIVVRDIPELAKEAASKLVDVSYTVIL